MGHLIAILFWMIFPHLKNSPKDFVCMIFVRPISKKEYNFGIVAGFAVKEWGPDWTKKGIKDLTERKERLEKSKKETEYEIANLTLALEKLKEEE